MTNTTLTGAEGKADDFDWNPENRDVLVPMAPALALYVTYWNQIVLRKYVEAGDVIVEINKHDVPGLIARLKELLELIPESSLSKSPSGDFIKDCIAFVT
jgi:hypothetical protein